MAEILRQKLEKRLAELQTTRRRWEPDWEAEAAQFLQYRWRKWGRGDQNNPKAKAPLLISSIPARAVRIFAAGLMAGVTSPSRIWAKTTIGSPRLKDHHGSREWLDEVDKLIREALAMGRWYHALAGGVYPDVAQFGTGCGWMDADPEGGILCEDLTAGEYWVDVDKLGRADTVFRECNGYTARTLVEEFGIEAVSANTQASYLSGAYNKPQTVYHAVFPNADIKIGNLGAQGMKFSSVQWEKDAPYTEKNGGLLSVGGYEEFPAQVPRWLVVSREPYGRGQPGWEAKSDAKGVQHYELRKQRLIDKLADPPMAAVKSLRHKRASLMSGDCTYVESHQGGVKAQYAPAYLVPPGAIKEVRDAIREHEVRVNRAYFVDLWTAILDLGQRRAQPPTATEVNETRQDVMLQLGPVLQQLNDELLEPAWVRTFNILMRQGRLPPPPREIIEEQPKLQVDFISIMHQVQKMTGIVGIRQLVAEIGNLASIGKQEALDKIDADALVDELGDILGVSPRLIMSEERVTAYRAARAEQQQAQQEGQAMLSATQGAKNLKDVDPDQVRETMRAVAPAAAAAWSPGAGA